MALLRKEEMLKSEPAKIPSAAAPHRNTGALLGQGTRFEGKLTFDGTVEIDGDFVGEIISDGRLIVGEGATVDGTIKVSSAVISGSVSGTLITSGTLELKASARVTGELTVASFMVDNGAYFQGTMKMMG